MREHLFSPEAEQALLGDALIERDAFSLADVSPDDFNDTQLADIWRIGQELAAHGGYFDHISIMDELARRGRPVPGSVFAQLIADAGDYHGMGEHARIVKDMAERRRALGILQDATKIVYGKNGTWRADLTERARQLAERVTPAPSVTRPKTFWTAAELLTGVFTRPPFIIDGLLLAGLTMLGGRPKIGKSWLALQLVQAVGTGGMFLGQRAEQGRCLYLALEDPPWRLAERMKAQGWEDLAAQVDFQTVGSLHAGGGEVLAGMIREGSYRLVVVDTLSRALAGDQNDGQAMIAALTPLQEAAHAAKAAVVMVDHFNKIGSATSGAGDSAGLEPDVIVNLAGTISKGGIADSIWGLYRNKGKRGATLVVTGRDIEEQSIGLQQDPVTHCWQPATEVGDVKPLSAARSEILDAIAGLGGEAGYMEVVKATGREKDSSNVYKRLQDLVNLGYLFYSGKRYALAHEEAE